MGRGVREVKKVKAEWTGSTTAYHNNTNRLHSIRILEKELGSKQPMLNDSKAMLLVHSSYIVTIVIIERATPKAKNRKCVANTL